MEFFFYNIHNDWLGWRRLMPLHQQSMNAMADVADAFVCQPPSIPTTFEDSDNRGNINVIHKKNNNTSLASVDFRYPFGTGVNEKPAYW
jgi:hypothetical protein